jgi:hypothetical protein
MLNLFFTHCSRTKDDRLKQTGGKVPPRCLYLADFVQRFCRECERLGIPYAVFSDIHGFVFAEDKIGWYDKDPAELLQNSRDRNELFQKAYDTLKEYSEAYFYHLPEQIRRLHPLYRMLIEDMRRRGLKMTEITDLNLLPGLPRS